LYMNEVAGSPRVSFSTLSTILNNLLGSFLRFKVFDFMAQHEKYS